MKADVGVAMGRRGTMWRATRWRSCFRRSLRDDRRGCRRGTRHLRQHSQGRVLPVQLQRRGGARLARRRGHRHADAALPLQLLWLNVVTDTFPALALRWSPADDDVMERPPRDPQAAILSARFVTSVCLHALLITASTLAAFFWTLGADPAHAQSVAFMTLALAQTFHLGNARSERHVIGLRRMTPICLRSRPSSFASRCRWRSRRSGGSPRSCTSSHSVSRNGSSWQAHLVLPAIVGQASRWFSR